MSWLADPKYQDKDKLKNLLDTNEVTEDQYRALKGFHKHVGFVCDSPSDKDKLILAEAYSDCELNT